jgi:transposase-like protein
MKKSKKSKKLKYDRTHLQFSREQKISIVGEIESGKLTRKEAREKYNIVGHGTLNSWLLQYSSNPEGMIGKLHKKADQRLAAYKIVTGESTVDKTALAMGVTRGTVSGWVRKYKNDVHQNLPPAVASNQFHQLSTSDKVQQKAFDELKLKIAGLEMMIDIAEKELKIDIRKKSGTKQ